MNIKLETKRDHEELIVRIEGVFTISYEGSAKWLQELHDFIDEKAI
jgi:hypothetical protein